MAALTEKKLDYDSKLISFSEKGHKGQEVVAINPRGQVPAFKDGSVVVNESIAALFYLEQKYPDPSLMPTHLYPQVLQRTLEAAGFSDWTRALMQAKKDPAAFADKLQAFKTELGYWEQHLSAHKYVAGDECTLADLAFAPQALLFIRQGASFDGFPKLQAYLASIKERPSIKENWPPHWKETPNLDTFKEHL